MELNEYQERAMSTCTDSSNNFGYMLLGLAGEFGELAGKCAKHIRKQQAEISDNQFNFIGSITIEEVNDACKELRREAGDCLWMLSGLCKVMGWPLEEVAQENLDKLADRKKRNVIVGDGDNR